MALPCGTSWRLDAVPFRPHRETLSFRAPLPDVEFLLTNNDVKGVCRNSTSNRREGNPVEEKKKFQAIWKRPDYLKHEISILTLFFITR
jgi:hypothetical protein